MSTTTTNYGLVKPELTDAADITAMNPNWDKIDQELNKKYGTDNKPTASDVGALPNNEPVPINKGGTGATTVVDARVGLQFYNNIEELGLSQTPTPPTMDEINNALPVYSRLVYDVSIYYTVGTGNENVPNAYGNLIVDKSSNNGRVSFMFVSKGFGIWIGTFNSDNTFNKWIELADASKFLPLTGGTLSGSLYVKKSTYPLVSINNLEYGSEVELLAGKHSSQLIARDVYGDTSNQRSVQLNDSINTPSLNTALQIVNKISGSTSYYKIFGEHNKPSGSYTGNGSATSRMIEIGGIGNAVIVICTANSTALIITASGAFGKTGGSTGYFSYDTVHFTNGIITIASTDGSLNASGKNYTYQVL